MSPLRRPSSRVFFCYGKRRPTGSTLFPYTTLFRSRQNGHRIEEMEADVCAHLLDRERRRVRRERSEEHTSELQSLRHLVCRLLLEKKKTDCVLSPTPTADQTITPARIT